MPSKFSVSHLTIAYCQRSEGSTEASLPDLRGPESRGYALPENFFVLPPGPSLPPLAPTGTNY